MDVDQILLQFLITVFAVAFVCLVNWAHRNIALRYWKNKEMFQRLSNEANIVSRQDAILCRKILLERVTRYRRSMVGASVKHTIDEELEKLKHVSDSIKCVQNLPTTVPGLHTLDSKDPGKQVSTLIGNEVNLQQSNAVELELSCKQLQSKLRSLMTSTKNNRQVRRPHAKQYSVYHFRVYLNNDKIP